MPHPFPPDVPPRPLARPRSKALPPPSLLWGDVLIVLSLGLILLQL